MTAQDRLDRLSLPRTFRPSYSACAVGGILLRFGLMFVALTIWADPHPATISDRTGWVIALGIQLLVSAFGVWLIERASGAIEMPFWMAGDHFMVAWGSANAATPQLFFIDTGMTEEGFTAPQSTLQLAGIAPRSGGAESGTGGGGAFTNLPITVAKLTLGAARQENIPGSATAFPPSLENSLGFHIGGLISHTFFRPYAVTFDFDAMRLYLQPPVPIGSTSKPAR